MFVSVVEYGTPAYAEIVKLRDQILRKPLSLEFSCEEMLVEYKDKHLGLYNDKHQLIGCALLQADADQPHVARMRQVAIQETEQGKGYGRILIDAFERIVIASGFTEIQLHARYEAIPFYQKLGYRKQGKAFKEVGLKHYAMRKKLRVKQHEAA